MSGVKSTCAACGVPLTLPVPEPFAEAGLVAALCPACSDRQFLSGGGAILALRHELEGARFSLGKVTITGGAIEALAAAGERAVTFLARHVRGDWDEYGHCDEIQLTAEGRRQGWAATADSGKINQSNFLGRRDRVMNEYTTCRGTRLGAITCLDGGGGTTVFLPEE